jgi:integrase
MPSGAAVIRYAGKRGVVWRIKYRDAASRQVMETVGAERDGVTRKQAEAELRERLVRVERKGYRRPKPITFGVYADRWLEEAERRRGWKPHTTRGNRDAVRRLRPFFGRLRLASIRPRDVTVFIQEALVDYAPATVNLDVNVLVDVFNSAIREELIETNPATHVERPRLPHNRWRILEPGEVARVAKAFTDEVARVMFLTLVLTGLRRFELLALRWRDVDLLEGVLRVRDSKSEDGIRSIAFSSRLADELRDHWRRSPYRGVDEFIFCDLENGRPYPAKRFAAQFRAALEAAGITGHVRPFHDLRHTAITNDAASGSNAIAVMTKAGHADMKTTRRYMHLAGVVFRDEADRFEARLLGQSNEAPKATAP